MDCLNCGTRLQGEFCSQCGQNAHEGRHPTLGHFFHDLVHESLHLDGKIWRTLKSLFLRPGQLTSEYWAGRINSWIRPIRIFLTVVALHALLFNTGVGPLNFRSVVIQDKDGNRDVVISPDPKLVKIRPGFQRVGTAEQERYERTLRKAYGSVRYSSVLFFAAVSWLVYRRRQEFFSQHLIFGLHVFSVWYAVAAIVSPYPVISQSVVLLLPVYLGFALKRIYDQSIPRTVLGSVLLAATLVGIEAGWAALAATLVDTGLFGPR
jgi:Protein of unknown function (DUF3667)